jgi:hypothetical protein
MMMKKMKTRIIMLFFPVALLLASGCGGERPSAPDGDGIISLVIVDTTGTLPGAVPGEPAVVSGAVVSLQSNSHEHVEVTESDGGGAAAFAALPAGDYTLFARRELLGAQKKVFTGFTELHVTGTEMVTDTIYVSVVTVNALMINEIYYCGGDYSKYYFFDQFVEIFNSSQDTLYLDGCILTRNMPTIDPEIEVIDHVRALYAFQFPGTPVTGREHPIYPGQYVLVAADAIDHSIWAKALDLSGADWEFFNPLGSDYDVPGVPNVTSIHPDSRTDFMINLVHNAVVFATGEEYAFESYINSAGYERTRVTLPLYTVIDGVEYAPTSDRTKELTMRVDAGFAGLGCTKYSGQSTERREIGFDINNSTFGFVLISPPTPGYTHVQQVP